MPWLFTSMNLKDLVEITPSVKTRLAMITLIGPRLIDPRAKIDYFLGLFRFSEEKEKVQEILKTRTHVLSSSAFRTGFSLSPVAGADSPAPKPFVAIPGMAKAREKVTKPIVKLRRPGAEIPAENTTKPPGPPGRGTPLEKVWENGSSPPRIPIKKPLERIFETRAASPPKKRAITPPRVTRAVIPPKTRVVSPPKMRDVSPPKMRAATPPLVRDISPPKMRDVSPPKIRAATPPKARAATPPKIRAATPPKIRAATPPKIRAATPPKIRAATPPKARAATPPKIRAPTPPKVPKVVAFEKAEEISPCPRTTIVAEEPEDQESNPGSIPAPIPTPILKPTTILKPNPPPPNKEMKMGNGTYNVGPTKRRSIPNREALRTIVTILPVIADPQNGGLPQTPVYVISDDSDIDNYGAESKAMETKNGDKNHSSDALDCTTRPSRLVVDVTLTKSPSLSSMGPPSPGSCGKPDRGSVGKSNRMSKSFVTKKFSPKYTPLAEGGTLIARDDKEETGLNQSKLEADLVDAEIVNMPPIAMPIIDKKKNGAKGPKKSVRMAAPPSPPRGSRNALSMSSANGQSENGRGDGTVQSPDRTTIDIYASNELARSWRKSTRFVNVKSLAYDFDRMKERGEKQQKRRSQTPDRRYPKTEEKHGDDEDDDEEKDNSKDPQPWYITDKLGPGNVMPRRRHAVLNEQQENGGRRHSANDSLPEKNNSSTGQFLTNGAPVPNGGLVRGLSFYAKLPSEGPVEKAGDGTLLFRYQELVRMNTVRSYEGTNQSDLENYMVDIEFVTYFGMSKVHI